MNTTGGPKGISAQYQRPKRSEDSQRPRRKAENVQWKRIQSLDAAVLDANRIARDVASVIGRWLLFKHLTPLEAEAARRYAYIMGRFERYFIEGRRTARSPSYERAFGADQELERRAVDGSLSHYEKQAKRARKHYDKLQRLLLPYVDIMVRNPIKEALDRMCCEDIEPPAEHREQIAAVLRIIAKEFGVTAQSRRGRPRKGRG